MSEFASSQAHPVSAKTLPPICVVDDDEAARESLGLLLRVHGYPVKTHGSGQALLADPEIDSYGCLLLDMHMPAMTGLELLEVLRRREVHVPAIFITGLPQSALMDRVRGAKAAAFLAKPVAEDELLSNVERACASRA